MSRRPPFALNRRSFMGFACCGAAAALRAPGLTFAAAAGRRVSRIGLQLYTVREQLAADFEGTLERVAAIGFREVEFAGYHGRSPAQVKSALRRNGLLAPSAHVTT
ncbi:MAG: sugar phosphate isomerase/epimerase, partial [Acidobacteria bacterium]|nr:sugar phosphate isomerase/epimerase [Acidobacteriota bacterium]